MIEWRGTIHQPPIGKGRAKAASVAGRIRIYTPTVTANWEKSAAQELSWQFGGHEPMSGAIGCEISAYFARTAELGRTGKTPSGYKYGIERIPHTGTPDLDNIIKSTLDALQKARCIDDDKRICQQTASKWFVAIGEQPRVEVRIWLLY